MKSFFKKGKKVKIYVIIDRHEWYYGKKVNNLLVVFVYMSFPVQVLDLDRKMNSPLEKLWELTREFEEIFSKYLSNMSEIKDVQYHE